ncbi:MAG: competence/damage-inducible protein A [Sulfurospirillum sp.]|nr:competence/damage-inducible protein A [Sulfurospirillum sp.]
MNFYSVIIGTELLNGRRVDKHFSFINEELTKRGLNHQASFVIKDKPELIKQTFAFIKQDPNAVMFSFGGIGATPDDLTRKIAAQVFTCKPLSLHVGAKELIEKQFGAEAYPHRINMGMLPQDAKLLHNTINNVPGFYLFERYFFTPGFPSMAWPMITWTLDTLFASKAKPHTHSFIVDTGESDLIDIMKSLPEKIELSSLPKMSAGKRQVEIYLAAYDKDLLEQCYSNFLLHVKQKGFTCKVLD